MDPMEIAGKPSEPKHMAERIPAMKFTLPKGYVCADALEELAKYIRDNMEDYPLLKSNLNIYFELKSETGAECPGNYWDLAYRQGTFENLSEEAINTGIQVILQLMERDLVTMAGAVESASKELEGCRKRLSKAEEHGFSTADKWRSEIKRLEAAIATDCPRQANLARKIRQCLDDRLVFWRVNKVNTGKWSAVQYYLLPVIDREHKILKKTLYYSRSGFTVKEPDSYCWIKG